jgi:short-subunit dehydrogenase
MRIAGSRMLVTGAGHGLGLAIASALARAGAHVVLTDLSVERVIEAVAQLKQAGGSVVGFRLDVTAPDEIAEVRARIERECGPLDGLVNNAGVVFGGSFLDVPLDRHLRTVGVNLNGVLAMTHAFLPGLIERPTAHIVNIASAAAVVALPQATSYAASKWAVLGFSESLREELRGLGHRHVGITTVCPGYISTGLFTGAKPARLTRWLRPEAVADAVVRAVETEREFVMLPWQARAMYWLCAGWPRSWYRAVCRGLGISRGMDEWQGHATSTDRTKPAERDLVERPR